MTEALNAIVGTGGSLLWVIVAFLIILTIVIFVHEMGHYLVGRWCGIGVQAFSIGFGPELVGFNDRRGTRWKLCAIPLGGYVKFAGDMNATSTPDPDQVAALSEEERKVAFHTQPVWKRAATVVAGPLFNFLLTIAVFATLFTVYGRPVMEPIVSSVIEGSAAEAAGFQPGDRFVSVDGSPIASFADVQRHVMGRTGDPLSFVMMRDGAEITLTATPQVREETDPLGNKVKIGLIGVRADVAENPRRTIEYNPLQAVGEAVKETGYVISGSAEMLKRFAFGKEDKCQLGGVKRIAQSSGKAMEMGFLWFINYLALLSVGIGFLNLLPIPPLDGGHLLFYGIEAAMRRPVTERLMGAVYRVGLLAVLAFIVFVNFNDVFVC
ncbi:MAG: RIP metalloprotease [Mesorhizobium sp.]